MAKKIGNTPIHKVITSTSMCVLIELYVKKNYNTSLAVFPTGTQNVFTTYNRSKIDSSFTDRLQITIPDNVIETLNSTNMVEILSEFIYSRILVDRI